MLPSSSRSGTLVVDTQASGRSWKVSRSILARTGLTSSDDPLLVLESGDGVHLAEQVEIGLADDLGGRHPWRLAVDEALAHEQKAAVEILEVDVLLRLWRRLSMQRRFMSSSERSLPGNEGAGSRVVGSSRDLTTGRDGI